MSEDPDRFAGVEVPVALQAAVIADTLAAAHPRFELPDIAARHDLKLDVVRAITARAGYPEPRRMQRALEQAQNRARVAAPAAPPAFQTPGGTPGPASPPGPSDGEFGPGVSLVPLARVRADPANVRDRLTDLDELAASIEAVGLLQPVVLRAAPGQRLLTVVIGHRRRAAVKLLGRDHIEAVVRTGMTDADVLAAMMVENDQRVDLDPIETARGYNRMVASGMPHGLVAAKVGRSQGYVSGRLALLNLNPADQAAVRDGTMTLQAAVQRGRNVGGNDRPNAVGRAGPAYFSSAHPLAIAAETACRAQRHPKMAGRLGGVACPRCWEAVIRGDEETKLRARLGLEASHVDDDPDRTKDLAGEPVGANARSST